VDSLDVANQLERHEVDRAAHVEFAHSVIITLDSREDETVDFTYIYVGQTTGNLGGLRQIKSDAPRPPADLRGDALCPRCISPGDHYLVTAVGELLRQVTPDTSRTPDNHNALLASHSSSRLTDGDTRHVDTE
jgi:hypothetical protein